LEHGLALRQRELRIDSSFTRVVNSGFQEMFSGLWLPKDSQTQRFAPPEAPEQYRDRPAMIHHWRLIRALVNEVPDDLFEMAPKPGEEVVHERR
jgi:hypothetical protein